MPQIKEFNTPALGLHPTETGVTATAAAARRIGAEYNEAGSSIAAGGQAIAHAGKIAGDMYVDYVDHKEKSAGAVHGVDLLSGLDDDWNKTRNGITDPNTPGVAEKWRAETLEPKLEQFKQGFTTEKSQDWAEQFTSHLRNHFYTKTSADMASMAGQAVEANVHQSVNKLSNTVRNDPTALDTALKSYEMAIDGMVSTPGLKAAEAGKVKFRLMQAGTEEIVKSAALGHIEKTGEIPDFANDPKYSQYIKPGELKQFQQAAANYKRINDAQTKAVTAAQMRVAKTEFDKDMNDLAVSTTDDNGKIIVGPEHFQRLKQILRDNPDGAAQRPGALRAMENQLRTLTNRMNKADPPAKESRPLYMDLTKKIADGTITDINQVYEHSDKLTVSDLNRLRNEFRTMKTDSGQSLLQAREQFFRRIDTSMDRAAPYYTPAGLDRISRARMDASLREDELRKAGKNPQDVYTPGKPDFFGQPENLLKYMEPSLQQQMRDQIRTQAPRPSVVPAEKVAPRTDAAPNKAVEDRFGTMANPTVPPPDKRESGKKYMTPKGPLTWTGTGWVQ
jgi:hypothetical protein